MTIVEKIIDVKKRYNNPKMFSYNNFSEYKIKKTRFRKHCGQKIIKIVSYRLYIDDCQRHNNKLERHRNIKCIEICACPDCNYEKEKNYYEFGGGLSPV